MRGTRVAPTVELNAPIVNHLEAAGVSQPVDVAHRMSEQEYDNWHEIVILETNELKDLMDLVGLKHKSATKLARYAEDYRRYNQPELAAEKSSENVPISPMTVEGNMDNDNNMKAETTNTGNVNFNQLNNGEPDSPVSVSTAKESIPINDVNISTTSVLAENIQKANDLISKATSAAQDQSDYTLAVELFREAIEFNPESDAAWFGLGYSLYQRDGGNTEEQIA